VVQLRPRLDEAHGLSSLLGLVFAATGGLFGLMDFPDLREHYIWAPIKYLTTEERAEFERRQSSDDEADGALDYADELGRPRFDQRDRAMEQAIGAVGGDIPPALAAKLTSRVLLVVDTFSQTSADDAKATVSRYVKTLRDLQERAAALGGEVTVLVIDHMTKSGETYMGSLAKEGDSDAMIQAERHGDGAGLTLTCGKMKVAAPFKAIHLEMRGIEIPGYPDSEGRPLSSLYVADGDRAHRLRKAVGATADTSAAVLLGILQSAGRCTLEHLRRSFYESPANTQKSADSRRMAFKRALDSIQDCGAAVVSGDFVTPCSELG
jgi:hypothetical protein